jgi:hypothetical protein
VRAAVIEVSFLHGYILSEQEQRQQNIDMANTEFKPKALILIADGTEEIEFVTPYDGMWRHRHSRDKYSF